MRTANFPDNKRRKQEEAKVRNSAWASLDHKEQLRALDLRPGKSVRQRLRIQKAQQEK